MSVHQWNIVAFSLTVVFSLLLLGIAYVSYERDRKSYIHRTLALSLFFAGLWTPSGFAEKIITSPSDSLTAWTYRWAYMTSSLAMAFVVLFALSMYLGRKPPRKYTVPILCCGGILCALSATPLLVESASYIDNVSTLYQGPLHFILPAYVAIGIIAIIALFILKYRKSTGIDRAQVRIILLGWGSFIVLAFVLVYILNALSDTGDYTGYAFLLVIIPLLSIYYAIMRLRFLDMRIILRRTGIFLIGALLLSLPVVLTFAILSVVGAETWLERVIVLLVFIAVVSAAPNVWKTIERFSSRFFFSGIYDERLLTNSLTNKLFSESSLPRGLFTVLSDVVANLGLEHAEIVVRDETGQKRNWRFALERATQGMEDNTVEKEYVLPGWLKEIRETFVTEEEMRQPKTEANTPIAERMLESGHSACFPLLVENRAIGYLLCGEKSSRDALSSTDIHFLESLCSYLGIYIMNYSLSTELAFRFEELESVYEELRESDSFKQEIIDITAHEFRTPVTIIDGFSYTLINRWDRLDDETRSVCLDNLRFGCDRLNRLIDKFYVVSSYQHEGTSIYKRSLALPDLIADVMAELPEASRNRINVELGSDDIVYSDERLTYQILFNLVENALDYSEESQSINVVVSKRADSRLELSIQDFGAGLTQEEILTIFDPFKQTTDALHHSRGIGLGLYIVRLATSLLDISLDVQSTPEQGTTVKLGFPTTLLQA
jgi:signal transduction histidine kinase